MSAEERELDGFGWPIRTNPSLVGIDPHINGRVCARPGCDSEEFRIKGFCSSYCRDLDEWNQEAEEEISALRRRIEELEGALGRERDFMQGLADDVLHPSWVPDNARERVATIDALLEGGKE